ncbi:MAG: hypothetical protein ACOH2G_19145 [Ewingella sp.]
MGSPPTLAQRVLNETLWNPAFFLFSHRSCAGHNGRVSGISVIAAKCRRVAVPSLRVTTRAKRRAVFHLLLSAIFECGPDFFKIKTSLVFIFLFLSFDLHSR